MRQALHLFRLMAVVAFVALPSGVRAEWEGHGALSAFFSAEPMASEPTVGGGLALDLWHRMGWFTAGGVLALSATSSDNAQAARLTQCLGLSAGVTADLGPFGVHLLAKGGLWTAALNDGFGAGPFVAGELRLDYHFHEALAIGLSGSIWHFAGDMSATELRPGLSFVWSPWP